MLYNIGCYIDVCYIAKGRCYIAKVVYTMLYSTSQPSRWKLGVPRPELARDVLVEPHVVVLVELLQGLLKAVLKLAPGVRRLEVGCTATKALK